MTDQKLDELSGLVYQYTLSLLDSHDDAERVASLTEAVFRKALYSTELHHCLECGAEVEEAGLCPDCEWQLYSREDDFQPTEMDEWASFDPDC